MDPLIEQFGGMTLDTTTMFHQPMVRQYHARYTKALDEETHLKTRFEALDLDHSAHDFDGDRILRKLNDLFYNGMGVEWSSTQKKIFNAFVDSCLPRIYGKGVWESVKSRVMQQRNMQSATPWVLVNMARRNGKTFVSAGTVAAMSLTIPGLSIAIFSTGERASRLFRQAYDDMLQKAFNKGTHVLESDYKIITKNKETLEFLHPSGEKQVVGCYPGSVR